MPPEAELDRELDAWTVCPRTPGGARHGECRVYRADGSLKLRCQYEHGALNGPFTAYHPDGTLARQGVYVAGKLDGIVTSFASTGPHAEPLRSCCVPPGATELRTTYDAGLRVRELFVDAEGRPLTSDGTPWPERPASVPADAELEEQSSRWRAVQLVDREADRWLNRYYSLAGVLVEEVSVEQSRRRRSRRFAASGELVEELHFDERGALTGPWYRRYSESPFADRAIVAEATALAEGSVMGEARFFDADGAVVRSVDRGGALSLEALLASPALASWLPSGSGRELVASLMAEGRVREAACAVARQLGRDGDRAAFDGWLARQVVPLAAEGREQRAQAAEKANPGSPLGALEALLLGGDPARLVRLLASTLPPLDEAALDCAEAALRLEPDSARAHVTRALLRLERGDRAGVLEDTEAVARDSEATASALRELCAVTFPEFTFWPAADPVPAGAPELEAVTPDQPLEAVQRVVQIYATRLSRLRAAVLERLAPAAREPSPAWLPPDTSWLLPHGPLELGVSTATITDETDDGPEMSEVEIDERLETAGLGVPALMRRARADWTALTWLCWSIGLDRLAWPERVVPSPNFGAAADRATTRCFRAYDQLRSGGLVARTRGVPDFEWEGRNIATLGPSLVEMAAAEHLELRAMFFWLLFSQNLSPFQSDVRRV